MIATLLRPEGFLTEAVTGRRCGLLWVSISIRGVIASSQPSARVGGPLAGLPGVRGGKRGPTPWSVAEFLYRRPNADGGGKSPATEAAASARPAYPLPTGILSGLLVRFVAKT
jgi:hypothetical protein